MKINISTIFFQNETQNDHTSASQYYLGITELEKDLNQINISNITFDKTNKVKKYY